MLTPAAVTFDFWNTLFLPGELALRLRARRLALRLRASEEAVHAVLVEGMHRQTAEWRAGRCWGPRELARMLLDHFQVERRYRGLEQLTRLIEASGTGVGARPVAGAHDAVESLRLAGIRLGVISDTGLSPGRALRGLLRRAGMLQGFVPAALTFSDEVGVPKPNPRIFQVALQALGVEPREAVHVGDLRATDVAGARAMGMGSVRFKGCHDDGGDGPEANVVIARLADLAAVLGIP